MNSVELWTSREMRDYMATQYYNRITNTPESNVIFKDENYMLILETVNFDSWHLYKINNNRFRVQEIGDCLTCNTRKNGESVFSHYEIGIIQPYDETKDSDWLNLGKKDNLSEALKLLWDNRGKFDF